MTDAEIVQCLKDARAISLSLCAEADDFDIQAIDAAIARLSATCETCQWWDKRHGFNTSECGRGLYKHMGPNDSCSKHTPRAEETR